MSATIQSQKINISDDYTKIDNIHIIQALLYKLFFEFHKICDEHELIYTIVGGTFLGAVRHQGMIPWDDDIDVSMPRPDYERFIEIVQNDSKCRYFLFNYPQKGYIYPFAKFCFRDTVLIENVLPQYAEIKLFIDVFPIDGYPTKKERQYFQTFTSLKRGLCQCVYPVKASPKFIKKIAYPIKLIKATYYRLHNVDYYIKKEIELAKTYSYEDAEYVLCMGDGWKQKGKLAKIDYEKRKLYKFGEGYAWGISGYDEHLTKIYGDYMRLPPKEEQNPVHNYQLYVHKALIEEILQK